MMVQRKCQNCKCQFQARQADVNRGWAKYCSKSCKAIKQEKRTGQYAQYLNRQSRVEEFGYGTSHGQWEDL